MNNLYTLFKILAFISLSCSLMSQNPEPYDPPIQNKYVSSPNFRGASGISIPLFSSGNKYYIISNSLSTQLDAIPVSKLGSDVGLNWHLNTGVPFISREVRGLPDEMIDNVYWEKRCGNLSSHDDDCHASDDWYCDRFDKDWEANKNLDDITDAGWFYNTSRNEHDHSDDMKKDYQPDIFHLSLGGNAVQFYFEVINGYPEPVFIGANPHLKITMFLNNSNNHESTLFNIPCYTGYKVINTSGIVGIEKFIVETLQGITYSFDVSDLLMSSIVEFYDDKQIHDDAHKLTDEEGVINEQFYQPKNSVYSYQNLYQTKWSCSKIENRFGETLVEFDYVRESILDHKINFQKKYYTIKYIYNLHFTLKTNGSIIKVVEKEITLSSKSDENRSTYRTSNWGNSTLVC